MKILSLFSGIGAFEKALDYLNVKYELVNYCEIDKYASKSYSLIHNVPETMNLGDITKVDTSKLPKDIDLITYGFPCQDISLAGKQKGFFEEKVMDALKHLEFTEEEIKDLYLYITNEKPTDSELFDKLYDEFLLYEEDINTLLLLGINKLTRSGLFFEALRIIEDTKPKVAIAENVKNLVSKKFTTEFNIVLSSLEAAGYNNYWSVLNAKRLRNTTKS